jgi:hypothetical protein
MLAPLLKFFTVCKIRSLLFLAKKTALELVARLAIETTENMCRFGVFEPTRAGARGWGG